MSFKKTNLFLESHPFAKRHLFKARLKYLGWQIKAKLNKNRYYKVPLLENTFLHVKNGMTGATGNIYAGLHEFNDMAFLLHSVDDKALFFDVGANIGVYTILASGVRKARSKTFEPVPSTFNMLCNNIKLNKLENLVEAFNKGVGEEKGSLRFSENEDTTNHVVSEGGIEVAVCTLNEFKTSIPSIMKVDVEGFELPLLKGATDFLKSPTLNAIIIELNTCGERYGYKDEEIIDLLISNGFNMYDYNPHKREIIPTNYSGEGNLIFIRDLDLAKSTVKKAEPFMLWGEKI